MIASEMLVFGRDFRLVLAEAFVSESAQTKHEFCSEL
jgi:hypothetical protein